MIAIRNVLPCCLVFRSCLAIIKTLHQTGTHPRLDRMRQDFPATLLELVTLPGIRADKIVALHKQLGVSTLEELEEATSTNRIAKIKGLGPALQRKVQAGMRITNR